MIPTSAKPPSLHLVRARLVLLVCGLALVADDAAPVEAADSGADALPVGNVEVHAPAVLREGIDRLVTDALAQGKLPGCVVVIGRTSGIVYARAFGFRALLPDKEPMAEDTIFDLASLTKPIATATSLMVLADQGKVDLDDRASHYVPEFAAHGKAAITLRQLLVHVSGLPAETPIDDYQHGRAEAIRRIAALSLKAAPGARFIYSDVGYLVLEEVIRRVTSTDLASFAAAAIFRPLGMTETGFLLPATDQVRIAPTEMRKGEWIRGEVHDPRAFRLGGVAGNAGLFSTAKDLARYARMLLGSGTLDGTRVLSASATAKMLAVHDVPGGIRALGWDMHSTYSANRGDSLSRRAVGHGGYTGTSLWIDPEQDLFVLFLSNRVHPDGKGSINALAGAIGTLAGSMLGRPAGTDARLTEGPLAVGIDALAAEDFARLRGLRFALLTNDAARTRDGARTTDVLAARRDLALVALLSPEHGLAANRDELIDDGIDAKTHLPVFSLYGGARGPHSKAAAGPRPVTLPPDIDAVVVDLPDVGARFFTYASTLHATMRAASERGLRVIVLDRPNPIGGLDVAGPMLKPSERSAVNHHPLPIRHGMTMGELAELMNADEHLSLRLEVVRMPRYDRKAYFDETGLIWWPPSPNLRTVGEAVLYPGVALLEATNVSVGRGTDTPFEVVGAPWIDGRRLAAELAGAELAGVSFEATSFTPEANLYAGTLCQGIRLRVESRATFEPVRTGIAIAIALRKLFRGHWDATRLHKMMGDPAVAAAIIEPRRLSEIEALFKDDLDAFRAKRLKYLLYPSLSCACTQGQRQPVELPSTQR
jgi:uncharacterized protein YbbC (DUF1343 family)